MIKDEKMDDVVTIIKTMSADKRKKLVATFKDGDGRRATIRDPQEYP